MPGWSQADIMSAMSARLIFFGQARPDRTAGATAHRSATSATRARHYGLSDHLGLLALLLALAMRLLVPTGFMWDTSAQGGAHLVPCSGMGPPSSAPAAHAMHHMAMAGTAHEKGKEGGDSTNRECAFSALGGALDLADPFVAPAAPLPALAFLPIFVLQASAPGRGLAAPPPPSRGPPVTF